VEDKQELYNIKELIYMSFPKYLKSDVAQIIKILPINKPVINSNGEEIPFVHEIIEQVLIDSEEIKINSRIYFDEPHMINEEKLNTIQRTILNCLYSGHHNGHIRQTRIENLLKSNDYFTIPFIISNAGGYLIEILNIINESLNENNVKLFRKFIQDNPKYWDLTKDRIVSYWNEFYRFDFCDFKDYVGSDFIKKIEAH